MSDVVKQIKVLDDVELNLNIGVKNKLKAALLVGTQSFAPVLGQS